MKHIYLLALAAFFYTASQAQTAPRLVISNFEGVTVPQYMGSNESSGARRLPVVFRARVTGLTPGTTYRYYVQATTPHDIGVAESGSGNPLIVSTIGTNYTYATTPKLTTDSSGILVADAQGNYAGWFAFVNTSNTRFGPDSVIRPTITLNEGGTGGSAGTGVIFKRYALDQTIKCLKHSSATGLPNGTGIYGTSFSQPGNLVALYADEAGTGRPLAVTYVETEGLTIDKIVSWYNSNVNGVSGRWGTIIPNVNGGVRNITLYNPVGDVLSSATSATGVWGSASTISPSGGTTPIFISATAAPLAVSDRTKPSSLEVYPNPAISLQTITLKSAIHSSYNIFSIDGKVVKSGVVSPNGISIALPKGVYVVKTDKVAETLIVR